MRVKSTKDIGLMIRQQRRDLGIGQKELADRIGVSRQWIVAIENGKHRIAADLLLRTLAVLELEVDIGFNPSAGAVSPGNYDIDRIIDRARKRK